MEVYVIMDNQLARDKEIYNLLYNIDPWVAKFFENAHWVKLPNSPFDNAAGEMFTVYAAQSAAITVVARESNDTYELQLLGW